MNQLIKIKTWHLLLGLAAIQLVVAFCTDVHMFTHEEAMWHYIGRNWFRNGLIPYSGGVDNKSPLIFSVFGISDTLFGVNYWFPRLLGIAVQSTGVYFLFKIAEERLGRQGGLITAAVYGLSLTWHATGGKYVSFTETYAVTCTLISIYLVFSQMNGVKDFVAGLFAGLGLWFRIASVFSLPMICIYLVRNKRKGMFPFIGGLFAAVIFIGIVFSTTGIAMKEFLFYGFTDNFGSGSPTDHTAGWKMQAFSNGFFLSELVLFYPFLLLYWFINKKFDFLTGWLIFELAGIVLIGIYASNHFKVILPPLSLMTGYAILQVRNQLPVRKIFAGICILFFPKTFEPFWGIKNFFKEPVCNSDLICGNPSTGNEYAKKILGFWIRKNTKPSEKVFVSGIGAQVQVYSERESPSIYFNATRTKYAESKLLKELKTNTPNMILLPAFRGNMSSKVQDFLDSLTEQYDYKGCRYGYRIFINKI